LAYIARRDTVTFYITTAIDYPNAKPHVGHSLEKVGADAAARYHRLRGDDVRFCMGVDENSQHVVTAARAAGVSPAEWVDRMDDSFRLAWRKLAVSNDVWVRTTNPVHARTARELFSRALARGDIYKGAYAGWYCPNCNNYYADEDLVGGRCPEHLSLRPEWLEEENYFFALTRYERQLSDLIEGHDDFIVPVAWRSEVAAMLRRGLRDFSVSRRVRDVPWGIPVPDDPAQVIYVWFDALSNYVTGAGFPDDGATFHRYWPADVHVIGKNITRFHCLYWPAMLLSAGLDVPRQVAVHGFMTLEGEKISKTTGNMIDPVDLVDEFGADPVRYYMLREFSFGSDGDFSRARLLHRYNADLANDLGNLLNRTTVMSVRYLGGELPAPSEETPADRELAALADGLRERVDAAVEAFDFPAALEGIWGLVRRANVYVEECEPWRLARALEGSAERARLGVVLANLAEALRILAIYLAPFVPETANRLLAQLGRPGIAEGALAQAGWGQGGTAPQVVGGPVLFPRRD
jgi:methionyl-tRNA synthetase